MKGFWFLVLVFHSSYLLFLFCGIHYFYAIFEFFLYVKFYVTLPKIATHTHTRTVVCVCEASGRSHDVGAICPEKTERRFSSVLQELHLHENVP